MADMIEQMDNGIRGLAGQVVDLLDFAQSGHCHQDQPRHRRRRSYAYSDAQPEM
jgi:hypothetical protein